MIDKLVVLRKIDHIKKGLKRLHSKKGVSLEEFLKDEDIQDIVLHNLQLVIQGCIDIGQHIVADEGWGIPGSLSEIVYKLEENKVISTDLGERLVKMYGFRNVLIHEYEEVDLNKVYQVWNDNLIDVEKFIQSILDYFKI